MLQKHHVGLTDSLPRFVNQFRSNQIISCLNNDNGIIVLSHCNMGSTAVLSGQYLYIGGIYIIFLQCLLHQLTIYIVTDAANHHYVRTEAGSSNCLVCTLTTRGHSQTIAKNSLARMCPAVTFNSNINITTTDYDNFSHFLTSFIHKKIYAASL